MNAGSVPVPYPGALSVASAAALIPGTIVPTADYTTGARNTNEMSNSRWRGVQLLIDVNNVNTTGTLDVKIQVFDGTTWIDLPEAAATQITAAGQAVFTVSPDIADQDAGV